jgi:hypothetical protein
MDHRSHPESEAPHQAASRPWERLERKQPEARTLCRAHGYVDRVPFGNYKADPLCVFMEKRL